MKNGIITSLFLIFFSVSFAQNKAKEKKGGWSDKGKVGFLFNQAAFSNWASGGDNTIAGNATINYSLNYKKDKIIWNNKLIASYGITKSSNSNFSKKTNDGLNINSTFGYDADNFWFYSFLLDFKTQFTQGYNYSEVDGVETRTKYTSFMSPGYLLVGPGMLWEKSANLKINLAPATSKFVFVDKELTLPDEAYFGVEEGKSLRYEIGFSGSVYYKLKVMENITVENTFIVYSNYIDKPQNIDLNYLLDIDMKINKYFSFDFLFQAIYDDVAYSGFQIREVFGLGINYSF